MAASLRDFADWPSLAGALKPLTPWQGVLPPPPPLVRPGVGLLRSKQNVLEIVPTPILIKSPPPGRPNVVTSVMQSNPSGSTALTGSPIAYAYRFQLCGNEAVAL